ncbi:HNH endonuclease [Alteromonas lipolytica]|uniref:HNH endonuclease n=1 Tax=Alteromonas lipolytica TaxID=1856405 RepID=A0A1E8FE44_9ALTE|nr:HNH endonuclease [Alteromonas lipolytica]OFI34190.1 HNH endonuclease [Alteromonas lipolytica]GGF84271.1 HNH endonuclease [Alteromonas lipolytica]
MSRKKFMESVGATCRNWNWSWSFVNHKDKFIVFGLWDVHKDGLIFSEEWRGLGRKQSMEHITLIKEHGYSLKTFPMQYEKSNNGTAKIKSFKRELEDKSLAGVNGMWYALSLSDNEVFKSTEEILEPEIYIEGATKKISVNAYERNPEARAKCIAHYGCKCYVCDFDFEENYGDIGRGFIHVHHEVALADIREEYQVDPIKDLKPLCPNCHGIIHRTHPPISIEALQLKIKKQ